jgi:peroxiredoxin
MAQIKVGEKTGDFILKNQKEKKINTADLKGKKLLLSFHPMAWTSVCAEHMKSLEANYSEFEKLNTVPLGISIDTAPSKNAWADSLGITRLDMLADFWPHGGLAQKLGVFMNKAGISGRANILLDENRKAVFVKIYPLDQVPDVKEIIKLLENKQ